MADPRDPVADLKRIAYLLEAMQEPAFRIRAFRGAATALTEMGPDEVQRLATTGGLRGVSGIGEVTERTILESLRGEEPVYLRRLETTGGQPLDEGARTLLEALRGDLHAHTLASDGGATIREMAETAIEIGHEYLVITDHSPRLTVANGLETERLMAQLDEIAALNAELAPFRILTGIEVDINEDGSLDQTPDVLERLDVVVGSVHSELRMDETADDPPHGHRPRRPEPRRPRPLHRADEGRAQEPAAVDVRRRHRLRRRGPLRQGDRGELAARTARPAEAAAAPGGRGRLPRVDRLRRPHPRPAVVAAQRLRARVPLRRHARDRRQRAGRRRAAGLDRFHA